MGRNRGTGVPSCVLRHAEGSCCSETIRRLLIFQVGRLHDGHLPEHRFQGVPRLPGAAGGGEAREKGEQKRCVRSSAQLRVIVRRRRRFMIWGDRNGEGDETRGEILRG